MLRGRWSMTCPPSRTCALRRADTERLDRRTAVVNPHIYHVSLTQALWDLKQSLIDTAIAQSQ